VLGGLKKKNQNKPGDETMTKAKEVMQVLWQLQKLL